MGKPVLLLILLAGALAQADAPAQDRDSPRTGNAERGRILLSILGPRPHDAAGISPLQQQELNRRVRCAATREEIQDELDFEAAGSSGFYPLAQLRDMEREACTPIPQFGLPASPQPQPVGAFHPPPSRPGAATPAPRTAAATPPAAVAAVAVKPPASTVPQPAAPTPSAPPRPTATPAPASADPPRAASGPSYTPAPDYPHDDQAAGHEGSVLVQLVMNPDGSVKAATVAKSSSFNTLDAAALAAARTWRIPAAAGRTIFIPLKFSAHTDASPSAN